MEKIKIKSVKIKKQTDTYKISEIETEDGRKMDTFEDLKEGQEYQGEITPNKNEQYNANFKLLKDKKAFPMKDYTFDKRRVALECAVSLISSKAFQPEKLNDIRDKFFEYLNQK